MRRASSLALSLASCLGACAAEAPSDTPDASTTPIRDDAGAIIGDRLSLTNPSFEDDRVTDGTYDDMITPAGWTRYDPERIVGRDYNTIGILNPTGTRLYPGGAAHGKNVLLVFLWRDETDGKLAGVEQRTGHLLKARTRYTLSVAVGSPPGGEPVPYDLTGFPGYRVELLAGDTVIARDDDTLDPPDAAFLTSRTTIEIGDTHPQLGEALAIRLLNLNTPRSGIEVNFDQVELQAVALP